MNLGTKIYSKEFISRTDYIDVSRHGSPVDEPCQKRNLKDSKIQESLIKKFSFHKDESEYMGKGFDAGGFRGFDGRFQYSFSFGTKNLYPSSFDSGYLYNLSKEEKPYDSLVLIQKVGSEKNISEESDIEKELMALGFTSN